MGIVEEVLTYENEEAKKEKISTLRLIGSTKAKKNHKFRWVLKKKLDALDKIIITCWLKGHKFPTGLLNIVKDTLDEKGLRFNLKDARKKPENYNIMRWRNRPHKPRYYQEEMIELGLKHERGIFESAVGTGKTLVMTHLIKELGTNTMIIVPSNPLIEQIKLEMGLAFGENKVGLLTTPKVKDGVALKPINLVTPQTLASLQEQNLIKRAIKDIDMLCCDEVHHAGSKTYTDLLPDLDHIYYRFGFTGTYLRNDSKTLDMWGFLSNRLYHYPAWKAIEEGFLTPLEYRIHKLPGVYDDDYQKEYDANYCGKLQILNSILDITRKITHNEQILVLVDRKAKSGAIIHEYLKAHGLENTYISGDDKKDVIQGAIENFNAGNIQILIGSSIIGEGIDITSTQHLILATGGKSVIKIVQAIGRAVRLFPGKDKSYIYDFCFEDTRYMGKHLGERIDIFKNYFTGEVKWV